MSEVQLPVSAVVLYQVAVAALPQLKHWLWVMLIRDRASQPLMSDLLQHFRDLLFVSSRLLLILDFLQSLIFSSLKLDKLCGSGMDERFKIPDTDEPEQVADCTVRIFKQVFVLDDFDLQPTCGF